MVQGDQAAADPSGQVGLACTAGAKQQQILGPIHPAGPAYLIVVKQLQRRQLSWQRGLLYAFCVGSPSFRRIEKDCWEYANFRALSGNQQPDHSRIRDFRRRHLAALAGGFEAIMLLSFDPYEVAAESGAFAGCGAMLVLLRDYDLDRFGGTFCI